MRAQGRLGATRRRGGTKLGPEHGAPRAAAAHAVQSLHLPHRPPACRAAPACPRRAARCSCGAGAVGVGVWGGAKPGGGCDMGAPRSRPARMARAGCSLPPSLARHPCCALPAPVMRAPARPLPLPAPPPTAPGRAHPMQVPERQRKGSSTPASSAASRISRSGGHLGERRQVERDQRAGFPGCLASRPRLAGKTRPPPTPGRRVARCRASPLVRLLQGHPLEVGVALRGAHGDGVARGDAPRRRGRAGACRGQRRDAHGCGAHRQGAVCQGRHVSAN